EVHASQVRPLNQEGMLTSRRESKPVLQRLGGGSPRGYHHPFPAMCCVQARPGDFESWSNSERSRAAARPFSSEKPDLSGGSAGGARDQGPPKAFVRHLLRRT